MLNDDQTYGFNLALELYTKLLADNKELILGIVNISYAQGIQAGIEYVQQQQIAAMNVPEGTGEYFPEATDENPFGEEYEETEPVPEPVGLSVPYPIPVRQPESIVRQPSRAPQRLTEQEMSRTKSPAEELIAKMKGAKR